MADAKAQTTEESQPRVTAKANTPNKLNRFNRFQLFVLAPSAPADGDFRLIRAAAERNIPTNEQITAGQILYTNQPEIGWSREQNCSDDFIVGN